MKADNSEDHLRRVRGWIGVELRAIGDDELAEHIREAWRLIAPKTLQ